MIYAYIVARYAIIATHAADAAPILLPVYARLRCCRYATRPLAVFRCLCFHALRRLRFSFISFRYIHMLIRYAYVAATPLMLC